MARVLIIDGNERSRAALAETVRDLGHVAVEADSAAAGLHHLAESRFDVACLDVCMPGMEGPSALAAFKARVPDAPPIVILTASARGADTINAMRFGAFDHLASPSARERVCAVLDRALAAGAPAPAPDTKPVFETVPGELVGVSLDMRDVHRRIGRAAASNSTVLILGEAGTGKELVARALHQYSPQAAEPFLVVNCASMPLESLESALSGQVDPFAFAGAATDRTGYPVTAYGGVVLLDEIGEMPLAVQATMLRLLEERAVTATGGTTPSRGDVRLIAATQHDLQTAVDEGRFRADLWEHLQVVTIRLPPLRERLADIIPLAEYFLHQASMGGAAKRLSVQAAQRLLRHDWPGNVRELKTLMDRAQSMVRASSITATDVDDLQESTASSGHAALPADLLGCTMPTATARLERLLIERAMGETGGNRAEAARRLGIHRQLLYRKLKQHGLD